MNSQSRQIKLLVEYDGTDFHGWQVQQNARTVQGELQRALAVITPSPVSLIGASRTDAGVHARGQVCSFRTGSRIPPDRFPAAINANLPPGIAVLAAGEVSSDFHPRIDARGKLYSYRIVTRSAPLTIERRFALHHPRRLDVDAMQSAGRCLVGEHDFASFQAAGSSVRDTVRIVRSLNVQAENDHLLVTVAGNGFLYNMVRIMVGTLLLVGSGKLPAEDVRRVLQARDRDQAGPTVPAHGLCLEKVCYREDDTCLDTGNLLG